MNAWQIVLFAVAVIAGFAAYGCGMAAALRASSPPLIAAASDATSSREKARRFQTFFWIFYLAVAGISLLPERYRNIADVVVLILGAAGTLWLAFRIVTQRHSRGWALGALVSAAVAVACLHFALH